ncbi:hypothetical protein PCANC_25507 [Puccinia coronata f. sp. avenae]|uniref:Uncharacterized protein n=1 Tax=Puccinia coronata f. sp. avenae TaxID=200324 RepID=A0A2N5U9B8_9BASI|nr:hypothetical protein PCANC_27870 [Puccinia coronata f. sp. avenae]PLW34333.1 hypothetical protein PCANC_25507 [Puccinia coronata f. sp. avenae]
MASGVLEINLHIGPVTATFAAISLATHSAPTTPFQTWHNQLGHAGIACIRLSIPGEKMEVIGSCDPCLKGNYRNSHLGAISVQPPLLSRSSMATLLAQSLCQPTLESSIIETKHAYFDESVLPSTGALNSSVDYSPHSGLPDFNSAALFPFQEEESLLFQDEEPLFKKEEDRMNLNKDEEQGREVTPIAEDEEETPLHDSDAPTPRRRLIIHGPGHPTLVNS